MFHLVNRYLAGNDKKDADFCNKYFGELKNAITFAAAFRAKFFGGIEGVKLEG